MLDLSSVINITFDFGSNSGVPYLIINTGTNNINVFETVNWSLIHTIRDFSGTSFMLIVLVRNFLRLPELINGNFHGIPLEIENDSTADPLNSIDGLPFDIDNDYSGDYWFGG